VTETPQRFPEYGDGGDCLGCIRKRRSFRLAVLTSVFVTAMLWFSESFLRYDPTERLYLRALTLEPEAARPFLRQAVKLDEATPDISTPKYLQALAEREEDTLVLETYEKAYRLDPNNPQLTIRYGCRLFLEGHFAEAREKFREAMRHDPENALPLFLEAATLPWVEEEGKDLRKSLALIAKANNSGKLVEIPRPLWSPNLPQTGVWYAKARRQIVQEVCFPLLYFSEHVAREARQSITEKRLQYWDSWLEKVQGMGNRLVLDALSNPPAETNAPGAAIQALAGVNIQLTALQLRELVHETEGSEFDPILKDRQKLLTSAKNQLEEFERLWPSKVSEELKHYLMTTRIILDALGIFCAFYLLFFMLGIFIGSRNERWTIPHNWKALSFYLAGISCIFVLASFITLFQYNEKSTTLNDQLFHTIWLAVLVFFVLLGGAYPFVVLKPRKFALVKRLVPESVSPLPSAAVKAYRNAFIVLARRFYGIATGSLLITGSCWVLFYRAIFGLYPWQVGLMGTGLGKEEAELVRSIIQLLK